MASSWDYFRQQFEAASVQAQAAASQASKLAEVVSAQVSEQGKVLAEQASSYSAVAAERATHLGKAAADYSEGARSQLATLQLPDTLANLQLPSSIAGGAAGAADEEQPSPAELETYGITPDFRDFIRSLTYSTFRDFPPDQIPPLSDISGAAAPAAEGQRADMASYLNPWLARHAVLVCSTVKEMNELRFVLVPKRLTDEQFWSIYFALTRARLPKEAFDASLQAPPPEPPKPATVPQALPGFPSLDDLKIAVRPAAQPATDVTPAAGKQDWLSALVCGFEVDIPIEKLQENTIVLGAGAAITSKLAQLQETARGLAVPDHVRANISANLANARDLMGLGDGPAEQNGGGGGGETARASPSRLDPIAEQPAGAAGAAADPAPHTGEAAGNGAHDGAEQPALRSDNGGADAASETELEADPDLEAYLRDLSGEAQEGDAPGTPAGSETPGGSDDGEFDKYLQEINKESDDNGGVSNGGDEHSENSSEAADLDDYINTLQREEDAAPEAA